MQNSSHANIFIRCQFDVVNIWIIGARNTIIDTEIYLDTIYELLFTSQQFDKHDYIKNFVGLYPTNVVYTESVLR